MQDVGRGEKTPRTHVCHPGTKLALVCVSLVNTASNYIHC